jgi:voltage-gated potassium channel
MLVLVTLIGTLLYLIEAGADSGFTSIPRSIYWAIVTLTTVGYGDIAPQTELGQVIAAIIMLMGYAIIAVPTGIVSSEFIKQKDDEATTIACPACSQYGHAYDAKYCKYCGEPLDYPAREEAT